MMKKKGIMSQNNYSTIRDYLEDSFHWDGLYRIGGSAINNLPFFTTTNTKQQKLEETDPLNSEKRKNDLTMLKEKYLDFPSNKFTSCVSNINVNKKAANCFKIKDEKGEPSEQCSKILDNHFFKCWKEKVLPAVDIFYQDATSSYSKDQQRIDRQENRNKQLKNKEIQKSLSPSSKVRQKQLGNQLPIIKPYVKQISYK